MTRIIEDIYQEIANGIVDAIDDDWTRAIVTAEIEEDNGALTGEYQKTPGGPSLDFSCGYEMYKSFKELRSAFSEEDKKPWYKAIFTLEKDGTFNLDFEYN